MKRVLQAVALALVLGLFGAVQAKTEAVEHRGIQAIFDGQTPYDQLKTADQSFAFFKTVEGGKYPWMTVCKPGLNEWDMFLLGRHDEEYNENCLVTASSHLENMVVLSSTITYVDGPIKIERKYQGYREPYAAQLLEKTLRLVGVMPSEHYKGTILVDEYNQGLPMKWVLAKTSDLTGLRKYFEKQGVVPADQKPLLLLQIANTKKSMSDVDQAFLNTYFTLLNPQDPAVRSFFADAQEYLSAAVSGGKDAKNICETMGENLFRKIIDEKVEGLEVKKLAGVGMGKLITLGTLLASAMAYDIVKDTAAWKSTKDAIVNVFVSSKEDGGKPTETFKIVAGVAGGAVATYIAYKLISDVIKHYNEGETVEEIVDYELEINQANVIAMRESDAV